MAIDYEIGASIRVEHRPRLQTVTLRDAIRYVVEEMPPEQQRQASIHADDGTVYRWMPIKLLYERQAHPERVA